MEPNSKSEKTTNKRPPLQGKKFSKEYQPSGEAKSKGKVKSRLLKDILEMAFVGPKGGRLKKAAAAYLDIQEEDLTVEDILHIRQIQVAVSKQNTFAYNSIMNRVYGLPKQKTELTGKDGQDLFSEKTDEDLKNLLTETLSKLNDK